MPEGILRVLRCPLCGLELAQDAGRLYCADGHSFDRARQGYVALRVGERAVRNADTPAMVSAREALLGSGLYAPIRDRVADVIATQAAVDHPLVVADLAGGTGYYLAGILDSLPDACGVCIDLSTAALKRAARCHPRAAAIGADLNRPLPLADESMSVVTSFFGPRNIPEIQRVMRPGAIFAIVAPTAQHLTELIEPLGMVGVDHRKEERLNATLAPFKTLHKEKIEYQTPATHTQALHIAQMGPSAHHTTPPQLKTRAARLPADLTITISVTLRICA